MKKYGFELKRMKFCYPKEGMDANILLIEAVKNGKTGLKIENPLFLKTEELVFQESEIIDKYIKENYISGDKIGEHIVYTK